MCQYRNPANSTEKMIRTTSFNKVHETSFNLERRHSTDSVPESYKMTKSASFPSRSRRYEHRKKRQSKLYKENPNFVTFLSDETSLSDTSQYSLWLPSESRWKLGTRDHNMFYFHQTGHHDDYASEPETKINTIRFYVRWVVEHIMFRLLTMILIFTDIFVVLLSLILDNHKTVYDNVNAVFVCYFTFEVLIVIFGIGWKNYKYSWINLIDCVIVMLSFIIIIILLCVYTFGSNSVFVKLTAIGRLARLLRILRFSRLYVENKVIAKAARKYVSRNKRRYQKDGFDLDLCYITERVIAMSIPSTGVMACYRNPVREVARFLDTKHKDHYKVYNLCSEKTYDENYFSGPVQRVSIDDHNVPKFDDVIKYANDVTRWMDADEQNVIAVHCKGGKGRTGMMICVWLVHCSEFTEAQASLNYFGNRRTDHRFGNQYQGVQTPSQSRYVSYFDLVRNTYNGRMPRTKRLLLSRMNIVRVSGIGRGDGTDLRCRLNVEGEKFDINFGTGHNCKTAFDPIRHSLLVKVFNSPMLVNDVKVMFFCTSRVPIGYENCAFYCWFHTAFIENSRLWLPREELDNPHKKRTWRVYLEGFGVDFYFDEWEGRRGTMLANPILAGHITMSRTTN